MGVEGFGELLSLATSLLRYYPNQELEDLDFRLVQAANRIMPEVSERIAAHVVESFERRVHAFDLNTRIVSAANRPCEASSTAQEFEGRSSFLAPLGNGRRIPLSPNGPTFPLTFKATPSFALTAGRHADAIDDIYFSGSWRRRDAPEFLVIRRTANRSRTRKRTRPTRSLLATNIVASFAGDQRDSNFITAQEHRDARHGEGAPSIWAITFTRLSGSALSIASITSMQCQHSSRKVGRDGPSVGEPVLVVTLFRSRRACIRAPPFFNAESLRANSTFDSRCRAPRARCLTLHVPFLTSLRTLVALL